MIYLKLMWVFFKIGICSFGGGYVMIPLIQKEIVTNNWLPVKEFADIVAISQMTPGPLAVNAATYVGTKVAGTWGSVFATIGVSLPSFILIILIAKFFIHFSENNIVQAVLKGIRPVTIGMMGAAVIFFAEMSIFTTELPFEKFASIGTLGISGIFKGVGLNFGSLAIFAIIIFATKKFKVHPIFSVVLSAVLGVLLV